MTEILLYIAGLYTKITDWFNISSTETCIYQFLNLCFISPEPTSPSSIFGFGEFIAALALLVVVYTITDIRYKFRIRVAALPLLKIAFAVITFVGIGSLISDFWMASKFPVFNIPISYNDLQFSFGLLFLLTVLLWLFYAFIKPTRFGRFNAKRYMNELYRHILQASEAELPIIANELGRSAREIVALSDESPDRRFPNSKNKFLKIFNSKNKTGEYAYEALLMIGTRRMCKHMVTSSPSTAIEFFSEFSESTRTKSLPIGQFVRNISTEAILNKDSILYHEDEGYSSGWLGYVRPFSSAVYGDYKLIDILSQNHSSPLDIDYKAISRLDSDQFEAYTRVTLITFEAYTKKHPHCCQNSYALNRAFSIIKNMTIEIHKINEIPDYYNTDPYQKLKITVDFINDAIRIMNKYCIHPNSMKSTDKYKSGDIYDHIVKLMFETIFAASMVNKDRDTCWSIHYGTVWSRFFDHFEDGSARKIILYRLRRALYDEICELSDLPNYKSARILAICLNVMGPVLHGKNYSIDKPYRALHKAVISWLEKNYLTLVDTQPDVAKTCITGSIRYDESKKRIIKKYMKGLDLEEPTEHLDLEQSKT